MQRNAPNGPSDRLINMKNVCGTTGKIPVHHATIRREIERGNFPPPIKIGAQNFWWESAVNAYLAAKELDAYQRHTQQVSGAS